MRASSMLTMDCLSIIHTTPTLQQDLGQSRKLAVQIAHPKHHVAHKLRAKLTDMNPRGLRDLFEERYGPPPDRPRYTGDNDPRDLYGDRNGREQSGTSTNRGRQHWPSAFEDACQQMEYSYPSDRFRDHDRRDAPPSRYSNLEQDRQYAPHPPQYSNFEQDRQYNPRYSDLEYDRQYTPRYSDLEYDRQYHPPPASRTYFSDPPTPGSYEYYLQDEDYHRVAHRDGLVSRTRDLFSLQELVEYRDYDETHYAGSRRSPIHGAEGHYGDGLRLERYIAEVPRPATSYTRGGQSFSPRPRDTFSPRAQPFSSPAPYITNSELGFFAAWVARFGENEFDYRFRDDDLNARLPADALDRRFPQDGPRRDVGDSYRHPRDPCPDPSVHIGKPGKCFSRRDAGYY